MNLLQDLGQHLGQDVGQHVQHLAKFTTRWSVGWVGRALSRHCALRGRETTVMQLSASGLKVLAQANTSKQQSKQQTGAGSKKTQINFERLAKQKWHKQTCWKIRYLAHDVTEDFEFGKWPHHEVQVLPKAQLADSTWGMKRDVWETLKAPAWSNGNWSISAEDKVVPNSSLQQGMDGIDGESTESIGQSVALVVRSHLTDGDHLGPLRSIQALAWQSPPMCQLPLKRILETDEKTRQRHMHCISCNVTATNCEIIVTKRLSCDLMGHIESLPHVRHRNATQIWTAADVDRFLPLQAGARLLAMYLPQFTFCSMRRCLRDQQSGHNRN